MSGTERLILLMDVVESAHRGSLVLPSKGSCSINSMRIPSGSWKAARRLPDGPIGGVSVPIPQFDSAEIVASKLSTTKPIRVYPISQGFHS